MHPIELNPAETPTVHCPRTGYNLSAEYVHDWHWSAFWRTHEAPYVANWLKSIPAGFGLDAGCGTAPYLKMIMDSGHVCAQLDISENVLSNIKSSQSAETGTKINAIQSDLMSLPIKNKVLDWMLITRVLSQIKNTALVFEEIERATNQSARILITDIHPHHPYDSVGIETAMGKVRIQVFKHSIEDLLLEIADRTSFRVAEHRNIYLRDLKPQPDENSFRKLYKNPNTSIFYLLYLIKP